MSLKDRISDDMKAAMRAKDAPRLSAIRLLFAAVRQREIDGRVVLADADVVGVVEKLIKQRRESIVQYEKAGREELAAGERFEAEVLGAYLPQQADAAEIAQTIETVIAEAGATGPKDMGKVMALLKARLAGRADMAQASAQVKARLGG